MKKNRLIYIVSVAMMVLISCNKEEVGPVITDPTAPVITAPGPGLSFEFTEATAKETVTFTWSAATNYGFAAAVTYKVEMSMPGDDFVTPVAIITTSGLTGTITYGDLNNQMMAAEMPPGVSSDVKFRISASVSASVPNAHSGIVTLALKPYRVIVNYPKLYVPGSYQGWAPAAAPVISSLQSDGLYEGYIWFADANTNFKFTDGPSWDKNWGDDGADGTLNPNGANIVAAEAGYFKINVNVPKLTYTYMKTEWGIIGSATTGGWDADQNLTYDPVSKTLSITLNLVIGDIKFRANDGWDLDFGDNKTNLSLEYRGANIPIAAVGNYTVTLDLRGPIYTYVIKKN